MRALCVMQPWANLIASGRKTVELRSWSTYHRGELLITASSRPWPGDDFEVTGPFGAAVCIVEVLDVRPATAADSDAACVQVPEGWYAWELRLVRRVPALPVRGNARFFNVDLEALAKPRRRR